MLVLTTFVSLVLVSVVNMKWNTIFATDPLWDGQQCGGGEAPCCTHPNMQWFIKTLNETTTEDIELRLCKIGMLDSLITGDTPLDLIELFVQ